MNTVCKFEECGREKYVKGYCRTHYKQLWQGRELTPIGSTQGNRTAPFVNGYKVCPGCNESKSEEDYYNTSKSHTGKTGRCKTCIDEQNKQWREANKDKALEVQANWRRNNEGHTYVEPKTGYVKYIGYEHPAAADSGITGYHRIVLWEKLRGQNVECHWGCGTLLDWNKSYPEHRDALVTDHLNGIRDDNRPENLVASCASCNASVSRMARKVNKECTFEGCDRAVSAQGLCKAHYMQKWLGMEMAPIRPRGGKPNAKSIVNGIKNGKTIASVAADLNVDVATVSRTFKRETGTSVREYRASVKAGVAA